MVATGECVEFGPKLLPTAVRQLGYVVSSTGSTLTMRILVLTRENRMNWVPPLLRLTPTEVSVDLTTSNVKLVLVLSKSIWEQKKLYYARNVSGCYAIEEHDGRDFGARLFQRTASLLETHRALEMSL